MKAPFEDRLLYLLKYTDRYNFKTILDIGPGHSPISTNYLLKKEKKVFSLDIEDYNKIQHINHSFINSFILSYETSKKFDAILTSHIMEHIQDTGLFLKKCKDLLKDDGILFIAVPPYKSLIVGGHVNTGWTIGSLMYNLILSGFDVRNGRFKKQGYNIIGFVKKEKRKLPKLMYDRGDIQKLKEFFPNNKHFKERFEGDINEWNWFK